MVCSPNKQHVMMKAQLKSAQTFNLDTCIILRSIFLRRGSTTEYSKLTSFAGFDDCAVAHPRVILMLDIYPASSWSAAAYYCSLKPRPSS